MRRAALVVAFAGTAAAAAAVAGCGGRQPASDDPLGGIEDELPGTCVDPRTALASTVADIRMIDRDAVIVCAGTTVCRKIELETGAMIEPSAAEVGPATPGPTGTPAKVATPPVGAGETVVASARAVTGETVALIAVTGGAQVIAMWHADGTPAGRFAPVGQLRDVAWAGGTIYVTAADASGVRGMLYEPDGSMAAVVGGDDAPIDVRRAVPMQVGRTEWAWLDAGASVLALHDVAHRTRARIDLGASGVGVGLSDARATPDGLVVIAFGGTRFGDIQVVETDDGVVTTLKARRCGP